VKFSQKDVIIKIQNQIVIEKDVVLLELKEKLLEKLNVIGIVMKNVLKLNFQNVIIKNLQLKIYIKIVKEENVVCIQKLEH